jgi:hypothetical protein
LKRDILFFEGLAILIKNACVRVTDLLWLSRINATPWHTTYVNDRGSITTWPSREDMRGKKRH